MAKRAPTHTQEIVDPWAETADDIACMPSDTAFDIESESAIDSEGDRDSDSDSDIDGGLHLGRTQCVTPGSFTGESILSALSARSATTPRALIRAGTRIGRYVVLDKIAAGGMGVVYRASDPDLHRVVAIKLLQGADGHRAAGSARLLREGQSLASLSHPNVLAVFDVGSFGKDVFVATEFVPGQTLAAWLKSSRRSVDDILNVYMAAGRGLAAAHRSGLVHRDFKPENVMVGDDGRVRVLDFGLARSAGLDAHPDVDSEDEGGQKRSGRAARITRHDRVLGTPAYMAPERHEGHEGQAADQFSFGVSLYQALYGELPFAGDTYLGMMRNIMSERVRDEPVDARVPRRLRRLIVRMVRANPADRFPSMEALLEAIAPRRRWAVTGGIAAGVAGMAVVATLWAISLGSSRSHAYCQGQGRHLLGVWDPQVRATLTKAFASSERKFVVETGERVVLGLDAYAKEWVSMRTESCEATQIRGEQSTALLDARMQCLDTRLHALAKLTALLGSEADDALFEKAIPSVLSLPSVEDCAKLAQLGAVPLPQDPTIRSEIAAIDAELSEERVLREAGRSMGRLPAVASIVERARALQYQPLVARSLAELGASQTLDASDLAAAEESLVAATHAAAAAKDDRLLAEVWIQLIAVKTTRGEFDDSLELEKVAVAAITRSDDDKLLWRQLESAIGGVYFQKGEYEVAKEHYNRAIALGKGVEDVDHANVLQGLAATLRSQGDFAKARSYLQDVVAIKSRLLGANHPSVAAALNGVAQVLWQQGKLDESEELLLRTLEIKERAFGKIHPMVAIALNNLGSLAFDQGHYDQAAIYLERALRISEKVLGPDHPKTANAMCNLARVYWGQGNWDKARDMHERALAIREDKLGAQHPLIADSLENLASVLAQQSQPDLVRAQRLFERALEIRRTTLGPRHPNVGNSLNNLAELMASRGQMKAAHKKFSDALAIFQELDDSKHAGMVELGIADLDRRQGKCKAATSYYRKAMASWDGVLSETHPWWAQAWAGLGTCLLESGQPALAVDLLSQALTIRVDAHQSPELVAETQFDLSRAMWDSRTERAKALDLARSAQSTYRSLASHETHFARVDSWLSSRQP